MTGRSATTSFWLCHDLGNAQMQPTYECFVFTSTCSKFLSVHHADRILSIGWEVFLRFVEIAAVANNNETELRIVLPEIDISFPTRIGNVETSPISCRKSMREIPRL
jgi:hypothetical protein